MKNGGGKFGYSLVIVGLILTAPPLHLAAQAGPLRFCGQVLGYLVGMVDRAKVCLGICNVKRGPSEYVADFGQPLVRELAQLGPEDWVLDLGAGEAHFGRQLFGEDRMQPVSFKVIEGYTSMGRDMAIPNFVSYVLPKNDQSSINDFVNRPAQEKPHFAAVARSLPKDIPVSDRFRMISGDFDSSKNPIHQTLAELPAASVIMDEFGILSYTTKPGDYLSFVFNKLKVGGSFFVNHSEMHLGISYQNRRMGFEEFMKSIPGVEVRRVRVEAVEPASGKTKELAGGLQIIKTGEVTIPEMVLGPGVPLYQGVSFRLFLARDKTKVE